MPLTKRLPSPVRPGSTLFRTRRSGLVVHRWRGNKRRGQYGPEAALSRKALQSRQGRDFVLKGPAETGNGGALKKPTVSILFVMLMSSLTFAQRASSASTGSTTTTSNGSCTRTSSTSTGTSTSSASQRTQSLSTPAVLGTRSKADAVFEAMHAVRAPQSPSVSSGTSSGVLLPSTVVPFR